jgi:hypothetical protein
LLTRAGAPAGLSHAHLWLWAPAFAGATKVLQAQHDGQISSVLQNLVKGRNEKYSALP